MQKYLNVNGRQLCYEELGDTDQPVILFIGGLGMQIIDWPKSYLETIAKSGYRVIAYDNRDIGLSDKVSSDISPNFIALTIKSLLSIPTVLPYKLEDLASDAIGVLDALNIEQAHLVGMSMGGMIAQIAASQKPSRILTLNLLMTSSGRMGLPKPTKEVTNALTRKSNGRRSLFIQNWAASMKILMSPSYPRREEVLQHQAAALYDRSFYPIGFIRQIAAIIANGSRVKLLEKIRCNSIVIHGEQDKLIPVECGIDVTKHLPNSKLKIIPGMGHDLPEELSGMITEMIVKHINSV